MAPKSKSSSALLRAERDAYRAILASLAPGLTLDDAAEHLYTNHAGELVYIPPDAPFDDADEADERDDAADEAEAGDDAAEIEEDGDAAPPSRPSKPATSTSGAAALRLLKGGTKAPAAKPMDVSKLSPAEFAEKRADLYEQAAASQ